MDSTQRFSSRVDNYDLYRPGYPGASVDFAVAGVRPRGTTADVGSGTGLFTEMLLQRDFTCHAVEPNAAMRQRAEQRLGVWPGFRSVARTAADTGLPDHSLDLIVSATAFHWFAVPETVAEFGRLLAPGGQVCLVWNVRDDEADPFSAAYEALLARWIPGYGQTGHRNGTLELLTGLFTGWTLERHTSPHAQQFDLQGLRGRLESSSYCLEPGHPKYAALMADLEALFEAHQVNGRVSFPYNTQAWKFLPPG